MGTQLQIEADVSALLYRALFMQNIQVFGEDGVGKHGHCARPQTYKITDIDVDVEVDTNDSANIAGAVELHLANYDAMDYGLIVTDKNAEISIANLLRQQHINPACLKWAPVERQGSNSILFYVDIPELLQWP